jgi:hypothetical protein
MCVSVPMAGNHRDQPARHVADADGQHHDAEGRLAEDGPDHQPLGQHAEGGHGGDGAGHGQPERKAQDRHQRQAEKGAQHHQFALGEAHRLGGLVDEHEAERDQAVDAALRDAADDELQDLQEEDSAPMEDGRMLAAQLLLHTDGKR